STFCFNFNVTLPVLAKVTLNGHAYVYGLLSAAFGVGALVGALAAASLGRASMKALLVGGMVFSSAELLLAPVQSAILAGVLLFFVGAGVTGIVAVGATALALGWMPRLTPRRRAEQPQHA